MVEVVHKKDVELLPISCKQLTFINAGSNLWMEKCYLIWWIQWITGTEGIAVMSR